MEKGTRLTRDFYIRDVLEVAPGLLSRILVISSPGGITNRYIISETEAYRGEEDLACHASKGRTARTETLYLEGGRLYVYLVYGMYWMLNVVTGPEDFPQAALIRGLASCSGPGRLTRLMGIDKSFNGEDLVTSRRIWIEESGVTPVFSTSPRIGIDYAGEYWKSKPWRYLLTQTPDGNSA
jgi:DNA-3-methyladenine glycosylase